ncbi:hypothetical protein [Aeromicrobium duanguangcaii]|uniref:Integral membrane protein n=1 Tax=Aeromicrobium duanguangcaii TaxID=2968086 RepID=A0ABY5KE98_9ACTN|nr:hypothetical protein [Aeromicrobium duanguangcaii]MCD9154308.1 hypothetical protein [Aeromicrobium duanguangcaii]MCL3838054.1 hypothetical protein [Aeromicrobium duanguangcaii]UUI68624.1 hypothetical protein NP095_00475 [Aeromicrobium duanguangcaii]
MRTVATALLWCVATVATFVGIGAGWTATHVQSESGFVDLVSRVGDDRQVQRAAADTAGEAFADRTGLPGTLHDRIADGVRDGVLRLTDSPDWNDAWAETARSAHQRLYSEPTPTNVRADISPLVDLALDEVSAKLPVDLPRPGELLVTLSDENPTDFVEATSRAATVAVVAVGTAVVAALLALAVSRRRGATLTALGLGAVLAAAAWWVLGHLALPRLVEDRADATTEAGRHLRDELTDRIVASLDVTLLWVALGGAVLVVLGLVSRARRS